MDATSRLLAPYLEKALGVTVTVENVDEANGWSGWTRAITAAPDGYTQVYANYPQMITDYLNPTNNISYTFRDLEPLTNHVKDPNVIVVNLDDARFSDFESFIDYTKTNEVTVGNGGAGSDDHILTELINRECGTKLVSVNCSNTAEAIANLYGNHIDCVIGNVADFYARSAANECLVLAVADTVRSSYLPAVATTVEMGVNVTNASCRRRMAPLNMDQAVLDKLMASVKTSVEDPDYQAAAEKTGTTLATLVWGGLCRHDGGPGDQHQLSLRNSWLVGRERVKRGDWSQKSTDGGLI